MNERYSRCWPVQRLSYVSSTLIAEVDIGLERTAAIRASTHAVGRWLLETCLRWRIVCWVTTTVTVWGVVR